MHKIILFFVLITGFSFSQEEVSYASVDSATYEDFMKSDFKAVRKTKRKANKEKIDFYYLRMRLGILSYGKEKYEYAIMQFEKAYEMNPADTVLQEYLYYAYLFSGRKDEANVLAESLTASFQAKIGGVQKKKIDNFLVGFINFSNTNIEDSKTRNLLDPNFKRGEATYNGNTLGVHLALENHLNTRTILYNKLSLFQTNTMGVQQFSEMPATQFSAAAPASLKQVNYKNLQYQYNAGLSRLTKKKYQLTVGFGFYKTTVNELLAMPKMGGMGMPPTGLRYENEEIRFNNFSSSLMLGKRFAYFTPTISFSYSNLYDTRQLQTEGSLTYYPFGNSKIYGVSSFSYNNNDGADQTVFSQKIGFKVTKWLWMDGLYSIGNHSNYLSDVGFTIYNTADPVLSNLNLNVHFYMRKFELTVGASTQLRQGAFNQYSTATEFKTFNYNYTNTNFLTTFKWNF